MTEVRDPVALASECVDRARAHLDGGRAGSDVADALTTCAAELQAYARSRFSDRLPRAVPNTLRLVALRLHRIEGESAAAARKELLCACEHLQEDGIRWASIS